MKRLGPILPPRLQHQPPHSETPTRTHVHTALCMTSIHNSPYASMCVTPTVIVTPGSPSGGGVGGCAGSWPHNQAGPAGGPPPPTAPHCCTHTTCTCSHPNTKQQRRQQRQQQGGADVSMCTCVLFHAPTASMLHPAARGAAEKARVSSPHLPLSPICGAIPPPTLLNVLEGTKTTHLRYSFPPACSCCWKNVSLGGSPAGPSRLARDDM